MYVFSAMWFVSPGTLEIFLTESPYPSNSLQPAILSRLLDKYQTGKNSKAFVLPKTISPVAWQHIHFHSHYTFCGSRDPIELDAMLANLTLEEGEHSLSPIVDSIR